jgi:2-oxoglutarate ferredoxin oxidoreductase subunit gamma
MNLEIQFAGFGGQGIVLAGYLLGKAISIYDKKNASMTQSYGPEARGGACSSGVVVSGSKEIVDYPKVKEPHILVVMSQEAYSTYIGKLRKGGTLIYDEDLVTVDNPRKDIKMYPVPATRIAEEVLGKRIVANVVMLGALTGITKIVSKKAMEETLKTSVKKDFVELNLKAFEEGLKVAELLEVKT